MTWFPVVEREMRVAARRPVTYRVRFWAVLVMLGFFAMNMMNGSNRIGNSNPAGRDLFMTLSLLAFLFAILIGVIATSDSVSEEKREGTLGLLFLTDLKGLDVILGKLVAHSINAFYALVAIMPILGMPLLMGGVTLSQFAKMTVALVSTIVLSLAAGIFVSTHSRNERKAMVFTFFLLLAITCLPCLVTFWLAEGTGMLAQHRIWKGLMFSPGFSILMALDSPPFFPAASYWYCVGLSWIGAMLLLLNAAKTAPRSWTESAAKPVRRRVVAGGNIFARGRMSLRKLLDDNPFLWLALRGEASRARVWFFVLSILAIWLVALMRLGFSAWSPDVLLPTVIILHTGLKIWMVGEASRRFVEDRRNNAMEFLLSTPLNERQIIRGQWQALLRQFLWPIVAVLLWEIVMAFTMTHTRSWNNYGTPEQLPQLLCAMFFLPGGFPGVGLGGNVAWDDVQRTGTGHADWACFGHSFAVGTDALIDDAGRTPGCIRILHNPHAIHAGRLLAKCSNFRFFLHQPGGKRADYRLDTDSFAKTLPTTGGGRRFTLKHLVPVGGDIVSYLLNEPLTQGWLESIGCQYLVCFDVLIGLGNIPLHFRQHLHLRFLSDIEASHRRIIHFSAQHNFSLSDQEIIFVNPEQQFLEPDLSRQNITLAAVEGFVVRLRIIFQCRGQAVGLIIKQLGQGESQCARRSRCRGQSRRLSILYPDRSGSCANKISLAGRPYGAFDGFLTSLSLPFDPIKVPVCPIKWTTLPWDAATS